MPHHITNWDQVSREDLQLLHVLLQMKFLYPNSAVVRGEIVRLAQKTVVQRRYWMKRHWKKKGGLNDKNAPRGDPYKGASVEDQMELMEKNISNRSDRPLEGAHGSKTIIQHLHEKADLQQASFQAFEDFYCKNGKWKNAFAEEKHNEMLEKPNEQPEQPVDGLDESVRLPKDIHIATKVLGKRSRYIKGVGPLPKLSVVGSSRATGISTKRSNEEVTELRQTVDQLHCKLEEQQQKMQEQQQQIKEQMKEQQQFQEQMMQTIQQLLQQPPPTCSST